MNVPIEESEEIEDSFYCKSSKNHIEFLFPLGKFVIINFTGSRDYLYPFKLSM